MSRQSRAFHGLEIPIRDCAGARAVRVVHPPGQTIGAHRHDWPLLTIPVLGHYDEHFDGASVAVGTPAAVLHPANRCHSNCIHRQGLETVSIQFDPRWLMIAEFTVGIDQSHCWIGGAVAGMARQLADCWLDEAAPESRLRSATARFLMLAIGHQPPGRPAWLGTVLELLEPPNAPPTMEIARRLGLHPAWLAHAYRRSVGEGIRQTVRRRRAERAVSMLRESDRPLAEVADVAGYCDQSHLNRELMAFTRRTPAQIRAERDHLRHLA